MSQTHHTHTFYIHALKAIHAGLLNVPDLSPQPKVNALFSELVELILQIPEDQADALIQDPGIAALTPSFRALASEGESLLEKHWATICGASEDAWKVLEDFPYYKQYKELAQYEYESMKASGVDVSRKIAYIGSGPLPLTAILWAKEYGMHIDAFDCDAQACSVSSALIHTLGLSEQVLVQHANVYDLTIFSEYTAVCVAALVGDTEEEKVSVVRHIVSCGTPGTSICVRSVEGLGALVYPKFMCNDVSETLLVAAPPKPKKTINTIFILKKKMYAHTHETKERVAALLQQYSDYKNAQTEAEQDAIGDAMFYADPIVWMLYKEQAYRGTDHAIVSMGNFRHHCQDHGGICAKRFSYLAQALHEKFGIEIKNTDSFPDVYPLEKLYTLPEIELLIQDDSWMATWREHEYYKEGERVAKWERYKGR